MTGLYLLDSNTASYIIKGNIPAVRTHLTKVPIAQLSISAVTEGELRYGVARRPEATRLQDVVDAFLARVSVLPWDSSAAREYGILRAFLEERGRPMGNLDMLTAAHAISADAILVSKDQAFRRIRHLKLEDWTKR
jgi:tRNA(fMet)-specific endonuclease VapC